MNVSRRPIWLAFVITPLLTPLAFFFVYAAYVMVMGYNRPGLSWIGSLVFMYAFGIPVGYLTIGVLGWPWVAKLIQWGKLTVGYICGGACLMGMVAFTAFSTLIGSNDHIEINGVIQKLLAGSVVGVLSGLIFCAVAGVPTARKPRPR